MKITESVWVVIVRKQQLLLRKTILNFAAGFVSSVSEQGQGILFFNSSWFWLLKFQIGFYSLSRWKRHRRQEVYKPRGLYFFHLLDPTSLPDPLHSILFPLTIIFYYLTGRKKSELYRCRTQMLEMADWASVKSVRVYHMSDPLVPPHKGCNLGELKSRPRTRSRSQALTIGMAKLNSCPNNIPFPNLDRGQQILLWESNGKYFRLWKMGRVTIT